mmetsp:Transcript_530/g.1073  ORF Transcript_530/g.1073 Transcript_530/m.1073 type:complete len:228 (-) Transcript_530:77-760(-)
MHASITLCHLELDPEAVILCCSAVGSLEAVAEDNREASEGYGPIEARRHTRVSSWYEAKGSRCHLRRSLLDHAGVDETVAEVRVEHRRRWYLGGRRRRGRGLVTTYLVTLVNAQPLDYASTALALDTAAGLTSCSAQHRSLRCDSRQKLCKLSERLGRARPFPRGADERVSLRVRRNHKVADSAANRLARATDVQRAREVKQQWSPPKRRSLRGWPQTRDCPPDRRR